MRKHTQSGADDADAADTSIDGVQIERIERIERHRGDCAQPVYKARSASALQFRRTDDRSWLDAAPLLAGQLARALVVALACSSRCWSACCRHTPPSPAALAIARLADACAHRATAAGSPHTLAHGSRSPAHVPVGRVLTICRFRGRTVDRLYLHAPPIGSHQLLQRAPNPTVWVTHDAGVRWAQAALPPLMGSSCGLSPAHDRLAACHAQRARRCAR